MTTTIDARGLAKSFRQTQALDGLDLVAEAGQVTALLGPNGAGKTTFVRAVATLLRLDSGTLRVLGHDVRRETGPGAAANWPGRPVRSRRAGDEWT
jgi:ABC-2 type transport system ATP-binding protein